MRISLLLLSLLLGSLASCATRESFTAGPFLLSFTQPDLIQVYHRNDTSKVLWETIPGTPFLSSAIGQDTFTPGNGHFKIDQNNREFCTQQTIVVEQQQNVVVVQGLLQGSANNKCGLTYRMVFSAHSERQLQLDVTLNDTALAGYDRIFLTYKSPIEEEVLGLGEHFSFFRNKGEKIPIITREQGVGRGLQPITFVMNREGKFGGGDRYTTYFGIPHYITSHNRSLFLENSEFMIFDLLEVDRIRIELASLRMIGRILYGRSPLELIEEYTTFSGRMKALPDWVNKGAIIGMQGGEQKVMTILAELEKLNTPIGGFWNQDWCGNRIQYVGDEIQKRLWWNWEPDREVYPNWEGLVQTLRDKDIRMMIYINPFLTDVTNKTSYSRNMYKEALALDYFVKNPDGTTLMIKSGPGISAGIVDLTNPDLFKWLKQIIKENMIGTGASGWMADFGEYLPYESLLKNGDAKQFKNIYPQEWARLNQEAAREMGLEDDIVYFMRAAYSKSPQHTPLFWAGDQLPTWDLYDGIKTTVVSMLTSGISGFAFQHSDIGGFSTAYNEPPIPSYVRSRELFYRWCELAAFTTTFRTHEGSQPDKNIQFYTDAETYEHFSYCAKLYASLAGYRKALMQDSELRGIPMARHLFLHYPHDPKVLNITYNQYLLGEDLLVAPVLDEGSIYVWVYLPEGNWYHIWSGLTFVSFGQYFVADAPLRQPGVFIRQSALSNPLLQDLINFAKANRDAL